MDAVLSDISKWFWNPRFWLPVNYTWEHMIPDSDDEYYPSVSDIFLPSIGLGICLLILRYTYARVIVIPVGRYFGIKDAKKHNAVENPILEAAYRRSKSPDSNALMELSKKTSMTERQIQRWLRVRHQMDAPTTMKKFEDCSWHFLFYVVLFWYGLYTLWDKPWFAKTINCWVGWPKQTITDDVYWYYCIELAFYWSLLFSLSTDHKRKDLTEMVTHHLVTIALVFFSFVLNFVRVGTLVLCVHDAVDYFLAAAKMATYIKNDTVSTALFVIFFLVWILSRLIIFPFYVIYSATIESKIVPGLSGSPTFMFFNGLLYILQLLHILWTYMIFRIAIRKITHGKINDVRSDTEGDDVDVSDDEDHKMVKNNFIENTQRTRSKARGHQ